MKVLVTGASGFLGRHVVRRLRHDGHDITGFDIVGTDDDELRFVVGDLRDADQVSDAVRGNDVVCHIGAIGDVYLAAEQPSLAAAVNVGGTSHIADAAVSSDVRVVYASTWEVYGEVHYEPIDEDHPCDPDHPYNITKLGGESMLLASGRLRDLSVLALRLGTAYGSGLRPNSVFRLFIDRARRGESIKILGDGLQSRQFVHAADIARAFSMACESDVSGLALNTVAPEPTSIKQLAEAVVARFPTEIEYGPSRPGDVPPALISSQRIGEILGWKPEISFVDGLSELMGSVTEQP